MQITLFWLIWTLFSRACMRTLYNSVDIAATLRRFFAVCYLIIIGNYNYLCSVPRSWWCALLLRGVIRVCVQDTTTANENF